MNAHPAKNTICVWYDRAAEEAARFYARTFPDSTVGEVLRAPGDFPSGKEGDVLVVWFCDVAIGCSCSFGLSLRDWKVRPIPHLSGAQPNERS